jgi:hypothetical protein
MLIDCEKCEARNIGCEDCVVGALLSAPTQISAGQRHALAVLAEEGMVPPLRLAIPDERAS